MNIGLEVERMLSQEVKAAARWCAERGYQGNTGDPLPDGLSYQAFARINGDLAGFREMVRKAAQH